MVRRLWPLIWIGLLPAIQFAAFTVDRSIGDFAFLALAISIPIACGLLVRSVARWPARVVVAAMLTGLFYSAFAAYSLWLRDSLFLLSEDFGGSAIQGIVWNMVFGACLALSLVSALVIRPRNDR
ncbi:MAG: hypothetical protein RLO80_06510 [Hyphomonas sp.]